MAKNGRGRNSHAVGDAIDAAPTAFVMTDARLHDEPLTYVNDAFQTLTLYSRDYALGRNCRFLQGEGTDPADVERIREGLRSGEEFQVTLTNHRADGTPFRNQVLITPIQDERGVVTAHFAVLRQVAFPESEAEDDTLALLRELQHRVKNHLAMVVSMIRIQASREVTAESLKGISRRVEALALLYEELLKTAGAGSRREIDAGAYLSRIATVISQLEERSGIRLSIDCDDVVLPLDQAARLGLLLSEFLTNSLEHAFAGRTSGSVEVRFRRLEDGRVRLSVEDDGIGLPEGSGWPHGAVSVETQSERARESEGQLDTTSHGDEPGVGGSIVVALTRSLRAGLDIVHKGQGTLVQVHVTPESG